jgi:NAD(P)-dependent dehydrogenase (short-subunit alcohol dehydrogenase family)
MSENGHRNSLEGQTLIVTGAGRGIGRDIALLAAAEGARVVVNDLGGAADGTGADAGLAQQVVEEIQANGGEAVANTASVADSAGAASVVQSALDAFGRIDCVVNNAGILRDKIFHQMAPEDFEQVVEVHLLGSFYVARAAASHFRQQESGTYVHFTSTSGLIGNFVGLSKSIALDMQRFNVRSNCVAPFAWSRLIGTIPAETEAEKARVERVKQMTPGKIAPLAVYLSSPLSDGITGQIFGVRMNEIFLFSQPRPVRSIHDSDGWTIDSLADRLGPAFRASFTPNERSGDVFSWDPV